MIISILQNNVEVLNEQCSKLQEDINTKCDELEQYSRRQCLRIEGIVKPHKEKAEDAVNLVKDCLAKADVDISDTALDRVHRIDPVYKDEMSQIKTFKKLLLNLITSDIDQCSAKIGKN